MNVPVNAVLVSSCRETDVFPVRKVNFDCNDSNIGYRNGEPTYTDFAYDAYVTFDVICPLAFCVPPFVVSVSFLLNIASRFTSIAFAKCSVSCDVYTPA